MSMAKRSSKSLSADKRLARYRDQLAASCINALGALERISCVAAMFICLKLIVSLAYTIILYIKLQYDYCCHLNHRGSPCAELEQNFL